MPGRPTALVITLFSTFAALSATIGAEATVGMGNSKDALGTASGTLRFTTTTATVSEGAGSVTLTVERVDGSDGAVAVRVLNFKDTATADVDFEAIKTILRWEDGDTADKTVSIAILDDDLDEAPETFIVTLDAPQGATLGFPSTVRVTISDNDLPPAGSGVLAMSTDILTVSEAASEARLLVTRSEGTVGPASIDYTLEAGSATAGQDYLSPIGGTLRWAAGNDHTGVFSIPLIDDALGEATETFQVTLSNPIGAILGTPATTEVRIQDDDGGFEPFPCTTDAETLCLTAGRFQVRVTFATPQGAMGVGQAVALTPDTGYFWFFNEANVEMVLKVLDACSFADRFWVFAGGLTNVEVEVTVTDSQTGASKIYQNPQRRAFRPIQDTEAFATCP